MYDFADEKLVGKEPIAEDGIVGAVAEPGTASLTDETEMLSESEILSETELHPETRHTSELSIDLHGKSHPDALYRAAGGDGVEGEGGRVLYGCPCCGRGVGRVLRVRSTKKSAWRAVCAMCAASILAKNPEAMIGGVVRAGRRKKRWMREAG